MAQHLPLFSVVVPSYRRSRALAACLGALADLDYPRDRFEVIVVDDGSEIPVDAAVAPFRVQLDVTVVTQPNAGPAAARNAGAARARGEFIVFTDDDCTPSREWLLTFAARFAGGPNRAIGGRTLNALAANAYSTVSQMLVDYLYAYYNTSADRAHFLTSNNVALPLHLFQSMGGFDRTFQLAAAEDREFFHRWQRHGYEMTYDPDAVIRHGHRLTFKTFWRQHFHYGRGAFTFHRLRAVRDGQRTRLEPLKFYLDLLRYPFAHARGGRALSLGALMVTSQVANAAGFFWEGAKRAARRLSFTFPEPPPNPWFS